MIGLLLIATFVIWLTGCIWLADRLGNLAAKPQWRAATKLGIFAALVSIPFVDELIGKRQFQALCRTHGIESADVSKARGKTVKVSYGERRPIPGTILPIDDNMVSIRDSDTGEVLVQYRNYYAAGGWVMRYTWLSMGATGPMLFSGNGCGFKIRDNRFSAAQISIVN